VLLGYAATAASRAAVATSGDVSLSADSGTTLWCTLGAYGGNEVSKCQSTAQSCTLWQLRSGKKFGFLLFAGNVFVAAIAFIYHATRVIEIDDDGEWM
jgi:hypothetical protein